MTKLQALRVLVNERLSAAAEEIFVLFERTIAEYEEENQRKQRLLEEVKPGVLQPRAGMEVHIPSASPPGPSLNQDITLTPQIKAEPEDVQLPQIVPWSVTGCVKTEESSLHLQRQSEHREETQEEEDISSEPQFHSATEGDTEHSRYQVRTRNKSRTAQNSAPAPENKTSPETSASVNYGDIPTDDDGGFLGKKYQCCICMKTFWSDKSLQIHTRSHTGERPYPCSICWKRFNQKSQLNTHMKTHTGQKPFSCSLCKKTFAMKHHLQGHVRTHTGETPYSCAVCNRKFNDSSNHRKHMKGHIKRR